jgi:hypothetical protein
MIRGYGLGGKGSFKGDRSPGSLNDDQGNWDEFMYFTYAYRE